MKKILLVTALLFSSVANAQSIEDEEKILGAIAGGVLGNTIGDGDGRKAATVFGAVLGYRYGDILLDRNYQNRSNERKERERIVRGCKEKVPAKFRINSGVEASWVNGCVSRVYEIQSQLEQQAFEDAVGR
jgi:uncharacterized protein YcfJ